MYVSQKHIASIFRVEEYNPENPSLFTNIATIGS
jgi:hypothetical protein